MTFLISAFNNKRGIATGTTYVQTESYTVLSVGIIFKFANIIAPNNAIIAPVTLDAHLYFCSNTILIADQTTKNVHRTHMLSLLINEFM